LDVTNVNNQILRTRYLGFCSIEDFSSSITVPLKEPGLLLKITAITGKASSLSSTKWCLEQYPPEGKWKCSPYYEGVTSCEGVAYANLGDCQEEAIKTNEREDYQDVVPGDIYDEIEEEQEDLEGWVLCEQVSLDYSECKCQKLVSKVQPCSHGYTQIGESSYSTKEECEKDAIKILKQDIENNVYPGKCYNPFYNRIE